MIEFEKPDKKILADDKITIPPSPFLHRLGYETGLELSKSPRAMIRSPWAFKILCKRLRPNKDAKKAEADLLKRVSHPNIARFRMSSKQSKIQYLEMEGDALILGKMIERKIVNNYEQFLPKQILKVAADIGSALDYLHTKLQILHGDVKSYNILVKGKFEVCKLCDFTATLPLNENGVFDKKKAGQAKYSGTDAWSAPEVIHNGEISCKTDIWALGLTLWEMLTLMPPHSVPGCTCGEPSSPDDNDNLDDSLGDTPGTSLGENLENIDEYLYRRYGTRPAVPVNVSEKQFMHALILFYWSTEGAAARRLSARQLRVAAADMLRHLQYGVWFPHLNHDGHLCIKS